MKTRTVNRFPSASWGPTKGAPIGPNGTRIAGPGNRPGGARPRWLARTPWGLLAVVLLGITLVILAYLAGVSNRSRQALATMAAVVETGARLAEPRTESFVPVPPGTLAPGKDGLAAAGLAPLPGGLLTPGSSPGSAQAEGADDLSLPSSSILSVRVPVPQQLPTVSRSDSQAPARGRGVAPVKPQPPAERVVPPEEPVADDLSLPSPNVVHAPRLAFAIPRPFPARSQAETLPARQETATPSPQAHPQAEPGAPPEEGTARRLSNLKDADLRGADLRGADLQEAELTGARLTGAKLQGATLRGAVLTEADLWLADLRGADLQGADLTGARFTQERQAAKAGEATVEAVAMAPRPGEPRPEIPNEILVPRRGVGGPARAEDPR